MNNNLKAGIISGLIAGIVAGIIGAIFTIFVMKAGLPYLYAGPLPVTKIFIIEIILTLIWGIILSVIFLKAYDVIPGKRISKYIIYGLFCHLVLGIRIVTFWVPYAMVAESAPWIIIGFPKWIVYALVLGFLYEFLSSKKYIIIDKKEIIKYDMISGVVLGAFLGIINGILANLTLYIGMALGFWYTATGVSFLEYLKDIEFVTYQFGTQTFIHLLWGAIFGAIFARSYNIIPGKGVTKGLYYGLVVALITGVHKGAFYLAYGYIQPLGVLVPGLNIEMKEFFSVFGQEWIVVDLVVYAVYGLLLGKFYKLPK